MPRHMCLNSTISKPNTCMYYNGQGLLQVLLCRVGFLKVLLLPALTNGDEKVIGGLACLMSEIGQAAPSLIVEASPEALALADALLSDNYGFNVPLKMVSMVPLKMINLALHDFNASCGFYVVLSCNYILGLDVNSGKNKKIAEDMFFSVFSALLDALLLRAQMGWKEWLKPRVLAGVVFILRRVFFFFFFFFFIIQSSQ
ncbi:hypothetical protein TEA_011842 [Camellia sinensis var. sinensis]|uniref:Uncharacterized protein n=1 Tax=Camellia sinensis var. sinensis TaxID=542762 RepID=A0A4S4E997_CAMSN|nr:hypothetical protein TEA_011842 [Camellia sinensis var. sinensis]